MELRLERKIDRILQKWKATAERLPLIVRGARQIGKTEAIGHFGKTNYRLERPFIHLSLRADVPAEAVAEGRE